MKTFTTNGELWFWVAILIIFIIYWLPTFFAMGKRKLLKVFILNLLMGWTVVGWVVAFYWAGKKD